MKTKNKLIIAFSALGVVAVAAVVALVAVLAAQTQTVTSTIRVTYTSQEVYGTASATFQRLGGSTGNDANPVAMVATDGTTTTLQFTGNQDADLQETLNVPAASLDDGKLVLTSKNQYVEFAYTFTNSGNAAYTATLTLSNASATNLTLQVKRSTDAEPAYGDLVTSGATANNTIVVAANGSATYYVKLSVTNSGNDLDFTFEPSWNLAQ